MFQNYGICPECGDRLMCQNEITNKVGYPFFLKTCTSCLLSETFMSSKKQENPASTPGGIYYDINIHIAIAFRELGIGYAGIESFNRCMNMPKPMYRNAYDNIQKDMHIAYLEASQESMNNAATEVRKKKLGNNGIVENEVVDTRVSVDGTWQKRGYSSLNGVVTIIASENGKCVDTQILAKECKSCEYWERNKNSPTYSQWKLEHDCHINHRGSSGSMESSGAVTMFHRSVAFNKLRYTEYVGDGDSSSFSNVQAFKPYPDIILKNWNVWAIFRSKWDHNCES